MEVSFQMTDNAEGGSPKNELLVTNMDPLSGSNGWSLPNVGSRVARNELVHSRHYLWRGSSRYDNLS